MNDKKGPTVAQLRAALTALRPAADEFRVRCHYDCYLDIATMAVLPDEGIVQLNIEDPSA